MRLALRTCTSTIRLTSSDGRVDRKPVWGTCAGLVLLAEVASATKKGGQELIGGLDIRVLRNSYGRQIESFIADVSLPFVEKTRPDMPSSSDTFRGVFIRAPVVEEIISTSQHRPVEVLGRLQRPNGRETTSQGGESRGQDAGDIVAVRQGNVFATSFHPELTDDIRIHVWWLRQVFESKSVIVAA